MSQDGLHHVQPVTAQLRGPIVPQLVGVPAVLSPPGPHRLPLLCCQPRPPCLSTLSLALRRPPWPQVRWQGEGPVAGPIDGVSVAGDRVAARRRPLAARLAIAGLLRGRQRSLSRRTPAFAPLSFRLGGTETIAVQLGPQEGAKDLLRAGTDEDEALLIVMCRLVLADVALVAAGAVDP